MRLGTVVRVAALICTHAIVTEVLQSPLSRIGEAAQVLLLPGDLTDYGLPDEARVLVKEVLALRIPIVAALPGSHVWQRPAPTFLSSH